MSYSQNAEEDHILAAVSGSQCYGSFLDIGAWDGKTFSNTLALAERGWNGVLVEPSFTAFSKLVGLYAGRPEFILVNALCGVRRGFSKFWACSEGVSTTDRLRMGTWSEQVAFVGPYFLPVVTVAELAESFPNALRASVVSIDTEGTSVDIFLSAVGVLRPMVWCIEHDGRQREILNVAHEYRLVYESAENMVLVVK